MYRFSDRFNVYRHDLSLINDRIVHSFKTRTGDQLGKGIESLSQWSNHWVTGRTTWKNRIKTVDSIVSVVIMKILYYIIWLCSLNKIITLIKSKTSIIISQVYFSNLIHWLWYNYQSNIKNNFKHKTDFHKKKLRYFYSWQKKYAINHNNIYKQVYFFCN